MGILIMYYASEGLESYHCPDLDAARARCERKWGVDSVEITDDGYQVKIFAGAEGKGMVDALFIPWASLP